MPLHEDPIKLLNIKGLESMKYSKRSSSSVNSHAISKTLSESTDSLPLVLIPTLANNNISIDNYPFPDLRQYLYLKSYNKKNHSHEWPEEAYFITCSSSSIAPLNSAPRNINFNSSSVTYGSLVNQRQWRKQQKVRTWFQ